MTKQGAPTGRGNQEYANDFAGFSTYRGQEPLTSAVEERRDQDSAAVAAIIAEIAAAFVAVALVLAGLLFIWSGVEREVLFKLPALGQQIAVSLPLLLAASGTGLALILLLLRWLLWFMRVGKQLGRPTPDLPDAPDIDIGSPP
jgi:hypothetical protein